MMDDPSSKQGPQPTSHKGTATCSICQQTSSALTPFSEYEAEPKLVCQECLTDKRVELCHNCGKFIVANDGQPCKNTIDAQQKGVLQWFCADCNNLTRQVTCLCGKTTIATTDGEVHVKNPERLNGQIYLCDTCKQYKPLEFCAICHEKIVTLNDGSENPLVVNLSKLYGFSDIVVCRSCWSKGKKCGICDTPATDAQGKCLNEAIAYSTQSGTSDYRCAFCASASLAPVKTSKDILNLNRDIYKWFDASGFKLKKYPQIKCLDSYLLNIEAGNKEPSRHIFGVYNSITQLISLEHYLPRFLFMANAAHEVAHAWQDQQGVYSKQIARRHEGFAEWMGYVYLAEKLDSFTDPQEARAAKFCLDVWMEKNPDLIYGDGLRYFLKIGGFSERAKIMQVALQIDKS